MLFRSAFTRNSSHFCHAYHLDLIRLILTLQRHLPVCSLLFSQNRRHNPFNYKIDGIFGCPGTLNSRMTQTARVAYQASRSVEPERVFNVFDCIEPNTRVNELPPPMPAILGLVLAFPGGTSPISLFFELGSGFATLTLPRD